MSLRLQGVGVSPGVAWAQAHVLRLDFPDVPNRTIAASAVESEVERLHAASLAVEQDLALLGARVLERAGEEESRIFDAQMMMVRDHDFLEAVAHLVRENLLAAETAYEFKALELRALWSASPSAHLRDRLADLHAIQMRMLRRLLGHTTSEPWVLPTGGREVIIVARELSPGLTVQLDREHVAGLVSEEGTRTSHAAILAHSLGIPAVMGVHGALARIPPDQTVLIDGATGAVVVDPTREELEAARAQRSRRLRLEMQFERLLRERAVTPDGGVMVLHANVDLPEEIELALRFGAEGVGLLRTEFLVTGRATLPTEDEQYAYFVRVAHAFGGRPVTIRSYDLGGDKFPAAFNAPAEPNPMLGWRSIRVCLDEPSLFRAQLRAILRAGQGRDLRLMLPLVTTVDEVVTSRAMLQEEADALHAAGIPAARTLQVGVMIETPAAALAAEALAEVSDFFSVGTNDLTQYTLAVDRGNARLADRFTPFHPAIVRQLAEVAEVAAAHGLPAAVCGEMASDPLAAVLLLGLGFSALSVSPPTLPHVKSVIREMPLSAARAAADAARRARSAAAVHAGLLEAARAHVQPRLLELGDALPPRERAASLPHES